MWRLSHKIIRMQFSSRAFKIVCGWEWRHMITVAMNTTTKRLIIHEAESTHKYHHKHPLEIRSTRKKNWNKRLTKHLGNLKKTLVKLQVISRWPRARQCRGPVRMLLINKGGKPAGQDTSSYIVRTFLDHGSVTKKIIYHLSVYYKKKNR